MTGPPVPEQVHVQFGADASTQVAVSWVSPGRRPTAPRLRLGPATGSARREVPAVERSYTEALTGERVRAYHARAGGLEPDTRYVFQVLHDGARPVDGSFRTAPRGRSAPLRFTSVGDQSIPAAVGAGFAPHSANAGYVVDAIDALDPLFHLANGDLSYANLSDDPVATWGAYFANAGRSARHRPWMPAAGNHENESGNGSPGYLSYQTRFALPPNGSTAFGGLWYAFTAGSVRVISLNNDDVCLQDGGFSTYRRDHIPDFAASGADPYVHGYSGGAQRRWLERELAAARRSPELDWIVVCMHQVAMSSTRGNGADLGIRRDWLPLFDAYRVDLVLAGHEHCYERTFPVRGVLPGSPVATPAPASLDRAEIDPADGTVHLTIGGGGHPMGVPMGVPMGPEPPQGKVITGVEPGSPLIQRRSVVATEPAPWLAHRETERPFGFACLDVDPAEPGGTTSISVTYYAAAADSPDYAPRDAFLLRKPLRSAAPGSRALAGARHRS
ncbi:MAG: purple acid phosphatase family protein [Streptosporangiaceae bacterium]